MGELSSLLARAPLCCLLSRAPAASTCLQATQATQRHLGDGHNRLGTRSHALAVLARPPAPSPAKEPGPSGQVQPSLAQSSFFSSLSLLVVPPDFATLLPPSHSTSSYRLLPWLSFTTLLRLQLKFPLTTQESRVFALDLVLDIRHLLDGLQRLLIPVAPASLSSPFISRSPGEIIPFHQTNPPKQYPAFAPTQAEQSTRHRDIRAGFAQSSSYRDVIPPVSPSFYSFSSPQVRQREP